MASAGLKPRLSYVFIQPTPNLNEDPTVVACGSIHLDTLVKADSVPIEGGTLIIDDGTNSLGSKGVSQVVVIVYGGVRVVMAGTVGEDRTADVVIKELNAHGTDIHSVQTS